ncbi:MAG: autotransporter-associated beta strand repeat-containing protein [Sphingomonadales bacterium]|nr:autotransporter-associated beta strand repeat-containing protein [Sphingomonadales bacterium]
MVTVRSPFRAVTLPLVRVHSPGDISGANGLTKIGTGSLALSGANTFTGAATVSNGTLELQGGNAIGDTTAVIVTTASPAAAGNFLVSAAETIGSLSGNGGTVVLDAGSPQVTHRIPPMLASSQVLAASPSRARAPSR